MMQLLARIDQGVGSGVMDKPIFSLGEAGTVSVPVTSDSVRELSLGKYDALFPGAADKPSNLYAEAQNPPPAPSVRLVSSSPVRPQTAVLPGYPPIAKLARVEGQVVFKVDIDGSGNATNLIFKSGHPLLRVGVEAAIKKWVFPADASNQHVEAVIEFKTNCAKD